MYLYYNIFQKRFYFLSTQIRYRNKVDLHKIIFFRDLAYIIQSDSGFVRLYLYVYYKVLSYMSGVRRSRLEEIRSERVRERNKKPPNL